MFLRDSHFQWCATAFAATTSLILNLPKRRESGEKGEDARSTFFSIHIAHFRYTVPMPTLSSHNRLRIGQVLKCSAFLFKPTSTTIHISNRLIIRVIPLALVPKHRKD